MNTDRLKPIHPLSPKKPAKKVRKRYVYICLKCGGEKSITRHHVIPKVHLSHFHIKKTSAPTVTLCQNCHREIEKKILWTEVFINRGQPGQRQPLHKADDYWYILSMFIGTKRFSELLKEGRVPIHPTIHIKT